jgi:hypothetical protein
VISSAIILTALGSSRADTRPASRCIPDIQEDAVR